MFCPYNVLSYCTTFFVLSTLYSACSEMFPFDIALHVKQYYSGEDATVLRFMNSAAGQKDWKLR